MNKKFLVGLSAFLLLTGSAFALVKDSVYLPAATDKVMSIFVSGDTVARLNILPGKLEFGSGSGAVDTNLYRDSANVLKTDDAFSAAGLTSTAASSLTSATMTGDLSGDGGDQFYGFLQNQVTASTTALTAAQCGSTVISSGAVVQPLPEASTVLGCRYTFVAGTDDDYDIDPADGTDVLGRASVDGAAIAGAAGDEYRLTDTGSSITFEAVAANLWAVVSHNGPITDVN